MLFVLHFIGFLTLFIVNLSFANERSRGRERAGRATLTDCQLTDECCRWTATIVALPIAMYTSYILYDRSEFFLSIGDCPAGRLTDWLIVSVWE